MLFLFCFLFLISHAFLSTCSRAFFFLFSPALETTGPPGPAALRTLRKRTPRTVCEYGDWSVSVAQAGVPSLQKGASMMAAGSGRSVFDLSVSGPTPAYSGRPGPQNKKQKQKLFLSRTGSGQLGNSLGERGTQEDIQDSLK